MCILDIGSIKWSGARIELLNCTSFGGLTAISVCLHHKRRVEDVLGPFDNPAQGTNYTTQNIAPSHYLWLLLYFLILVGTNRNYSKQPLLKILESCTFPPVVYSKVLSTVTCSGMLDQENKIKSRKKTVRKEALSCKTWYDIDMVALGVGKTKYKLF